MPIERIVQLARANGYGICCAESCTGGLLAAALTGVAGVSDVFHGGIVSYSNGMKERLLGVPSHTLAAHGAVSEAVARAMAQGIVRLTAESGTVPESACRRILGVAITGVAGPGGGSPAKPVGTVWFGFAEWDCTQQGIVFDQADHLVFAGDRVAVRAQAVDFALNRLEQRISSM